MDLTLRPVGFVRSSLVARKNAPRQGNEGAPDAWIEWDDSVLDAASHLSVGDEVVVLTWFHEGRRETLQVHPRGDKANPLTGVFSTRSPDRPNPIGLHRARVLAIEKGRIQVGPIEAIDGTPVVDIKPVLDASER